LHINRTRSSIELAHQSNSLINRTCTSIELAHQANQLIN
jgi:hypothetical protein